MPDLDQVIDDQAKQDPGEPLSQSAGWAGFTTAAPVADVVSIVIPGYSTDADHDCRVVAPVGAPAVGDGCLVIFDDAGQGWALFAGTGT